MSGPTGGEPARRHHPWRVVGFVALGVVVVAAGAGWFVWDRYLRNDTKPVDVAAVERDFAKGGGRTARPGTPTPGVYLYDTTGSESVTALGGATNTYPRTTTLTVTATACGVDTRWDVLEGRYDATTRCRRADGTWVVTGTVTSDRFFGQTQADTYTCPDLVDLPAAPKEGATWSGTCAQAGGSGAPNTTAYRYRVLAPATLEVAGEAVPTVHLRVTTTEGGQRSGGGVEERWVIAGTDLVVRSRASEKADSPSPIGDVTYTQRDEVALRSLAPRT